MPTTDTYDRLIGLLDGADYRLIDHDPEGATDLVSAMRGHPVAHAAKCLLLVVKVDKRTRRHVLAVIPGDRLVDFAAMRDLYQARYTGFADPETAEQLAGSVPGTVLPFPMEEEVDLVVDPAVLEQPRLWFNAARLDRSVSLAPADYVRIAQPRVHPIGAC